MVTSWFVAENGQAVPILEQTETIPCSKS